MSSSFDASSPHGIGGQAPQSLGFTSPHYTSPQAGFTTPRSDHGHMTDGGQTPQTNLFASSLDTPTLEVEHLRERKERLVKEVASLDAQKGELMRDKQDLERELGLLNERAMALKQKCAQYEQNLEAFKSLNLTKRRESFQDPLDDDREYKLTEREQAVQKRELELKSEADVLFQRKKELDLREFDINNEENPQVGCHVTLFVVM